LPSIDRELALRTLADLPLTQATRQFADWWLDQVPADGSLPNRNSNTPLSRTLSTSSMACEVRPWVTVLCRSCGDKIETVLGVNLAGRDMLSLLAPPFRPTRLSRYVNVAQGGLQFSHRNVTAADHTELQVQELMLPYPDLHIKPLENGAELTIAFLDASTLPPGTRVLIAQGALKLADDPYYVDLRQNSTASK
jgi:hypothetical protein